MSENLTPGTFTPADYTPDKNAIKPLEPFRFWCQHVLPLVYDDSLSYYELLCKVVDYLNKTMEDVDLLSQDVTNMFTAYGELQTFVNTNIKEIQDWTTEHVTDLENYVDNYFNNLNVQTEINNKLDSMALDGTLNTLLWSTFHENVHDWVELQVSLWIYENLSQETGYVIDKSLTVNNAAADAAATGDRADRLFRMNKQYLDYNYKEYHNYFSITKNKGINSSGDNASISYACRSSLLYARGKKLGIQVSDLYNFKVDYFTQTDTLTGGQDWLDYRQGGYPVFTILPDEAEGFCITFTKVGENSSYTMTDADATAIKESLSVWYEIDRRKEFILQPKFEHMTLTEHGSNNDKGMTTTNFYKRYRQQKYMRVLPWDRVKITLETGETAILFEYDKDMNDLNMTSNIASDTEVILGGNTQYIKFVVSFSTANEYTMYVNRTVTVKTTKQPKLIFNQKKDESQRGIFAVPYSLPQDIAENEASDYTAAIHKVGYSAGILMLPDSYEPEGDPVPLIIYCHSSGYYYDFDQYEFDLHMKMYRYLVAEGFAVWDTYGHSSFATPDSTYPRVYGNPDNMACYAAGYNWLIDNFNIRTDGVFVSGKSLGGCPALNIVFGKAGIPVKACGLMAPGTNFVRKAFGYTQGDRYENAEAFGLTDYTAALAGPGTIASILARPEFQALMDANYDKFASWVPFWDHTDGVINHKDDFLASAYLGTEGVDVSTGDGDTSLWAAYSKQCEVPVKVWCAVDDDSVPYRANYNLVHMLKNGGSPAELRTLKSGTGSHHAMDFDEADSIKFPSVTTATGEVVANVPVAYYELIDFFRRYGA